MTLAEFKAWFEGYTEAMSGAPNDSQWKRIQEKVAKIDGAPTTQTVFIDRYRPYWERYYTGPMNPFYSTCSNGEMPTNRTTPLGRESVALSASNVGDNGWQNIPEEKFDTKAAMFALGKAEFTDA